MANYSTWNAIDLHIHSKKSNEVKENDYEGPDYSGETILNKLTEEGQNIKIFSITDHNCINKDLYKEINEILQKPENTKLINYIVGVELDVYDVNIYSEVFHCLCFFESRNIDKIDNIITKIFKSVPLSERNKKENYPNISDIFSNLSNDKIENILLIPHFNNKSKGVPSNDSAIDKLNQLCFNAYEDGNNIKNIEESLKIYLKEGFDNFPFAVFSDNHDIQIYPKDKAGKIGKKLYMLSNIEHPFNSIKTAFEEPRLRISIEDSNNMRSREVSKHHIEKIKINNEVIELSPYQNTIIGKFGSGKSLLMEKIKKGVHVLEGHDKYQQFYSASEELKLIISGEISNSIDEALVTNENLRKYEFLQQEEYYYKNSLNNLEAKNLFERLNIKCNYIDDFKFGFNTDKLNEAFNSVVSMFDKNDTINNLNYQRAFSNEKYYMVDFNAEIIDMETIISTLSMNELNLQRVVQTKIFEIQLFSSDEIVKLQEMKEIISEKTKILEKLKNSQFISKIENKISKYKEEYINNTAKESKKKLLKDIEGFLDSIKSVQQQCVLFSEIYNETKFTTLKEKKTEKLYDNFDVITQYNISDDYKDIITLIKTENRINNDLFKSLLNTISTKSKLAGNKEYSQFNELVVKYCGRVEEIFKKENIRYDIIYNNSSILKKSAGEKSSVFIKLIFELVERDLNDKKDVLLLLDQPEDNIDNDNIYKEITDKLKEFKLKYCNFQSIIVTHNANIGITADSENIIIAQENLVGDSKKFTYKNGCIEDKAYCDNVCTILEGGKKALEQRTVKYGINIIKKVEANGM